MAETEGFSQGWDRTRVRGFLRTFPPTFSIMTPGKVGEGTSGTSDLTIAGTLVISLNQGFGKPVFLQTLLRHMKPQ